MQGMAPPVSEKKYTLAPLGRLRHECPSAAADAPPRHGTVRIGVRHFPKRAIRGPGATGHAHALQFGHEPKSVANQAANVAISYRYRLARALDPEA
jgi:hypothetical protein